MLEGNENGNKVNDSKRRNVNSKPHYCATHGRARIFILFCLAVIARYGEARLN